jgi:hypothetical protein
MKMAIYTRILASVLPAVFLNFREFAFMSNPSPITILSSHSAAHLFSETAFNNASVYQIEPLAPKTTSLIKNANADEVVPWSEPVERPLPTELFKEKFLNYNAAVKRLINPHDKPLTAIYGAGGVGIADFLTSLNSQNGYFINLSYHGMNKNDIEYFFQNRSAGLSNDWTAWERDYRLDKFEMGYTERSFLACRDHMLHALAVELESMGIALSQVRVSETMINGQICPVISFPWSYDGKNRKNYSITFVRADILKPEQYQHILDAKIDIYYQRAAMSVPTRYKTSPRFIHSLSEGLNPGGFFVTDDYGVNDVGLFADYSEFFPHEYPLIPIDNVPDSSPSHNYGWHLRVRANRILSAA